MASACANSVLATNGAPVTYFFVVENTGDVALDNIALSDNDLSPVFSANLGALAVGESVTAQVAQAVSGSLTNVAMATGNDPNGDPVVATDDAIVRQMGPGIGLSKTVSLDGTFAGSANSMQAGIG